jgi:hypothetical protein
MAVDVIEISEPTLFSINSSDCIPKIFERFLDKLNGCSSICNKYQVEVFWICAEEAKCLFSGLVYNFAGELRWVRR